MSTKSLPEWSSIWECFLVIKIKILINLIIKIVLVYWRRFKYSSHIGMWEWNHKAGQVLENWCSQIVVLEKTLESPLDSKEIKPVHPKGNKPWTFIERSDTEAEAPILWPPDIKSWLVGKDLDAGKDGRQKEKGAAEDEMVRQHHQLNGHEFEQTSGESEAQGSLACCSPWGQKKLDTT